MKPSLLLLVLALALCASAGAAVFNVANLSGTSVLVEIDTVGVDVPDGQSVVLYGAELVTPDLATVTPDESEGSVEVSLVVGPLGEVVTQSAIAGEADLRLLESLAAVAVGVMLFRTVNAAFRI